MSHKTSDNGTAYYIRRTPIRESKRVCKAREEDAPSQTFQARRSPYSTETHGFFGPTFRASPGVSALRPRATKTPPVEGATKRRRVRSRKNSCANASGSCATVGPHLKCVRKALCPVNKVIKVSKSNSVYPGHPRNNNLILVYIRISFRLKSCDRI